MTLLQRKIEKTVILASKKLKENKASSIAIIHRENLTDPVNKISIKYEASQCWSVLMWFISMQFAYLYTWNREIVVNSQKLVKRRWISHKNTLKSRFFVKTYHRNQYKKTALTLSDILSSVKIWLMQQILHLIRVISLIFPRITVHLTKTTSLLILLACNFLLRSDIVLLRRGKFRRRSNFSYGSFMLQWYDNFRQFPFPLLFNKWLYHWPNVSLSVSILTRWRA